MISKVCDICNKGDSVKSYNINLIKDDINLNGTIDLCINCANKIKQSISKIEYEV